MRRRMRRLAIAGAVVALAILIVPGVPMVMPERVNIPAKP